jgi:hypothetical protein
MGLGPKREKTELTRIHMRVPAEQAARYAGGWLECHWELLMRYFNEMPSRP